MQKLHFEIVINSSKEKVWGIIVNKKKYEAWTDVFCPQSTFEGDWSMGTKMLFLGPNGKGGRDGMVSMIAENRLNEFMSIKHIGVLKNGVEEMESPEFKNWTNAYENYTLKMDRDKTVFVVDIDVDDSYKAYFELMWSKALQKIKELAETGTTKQVTVGGLIYAPVEKIWEYWTEPKHIVKWCFASADWEAPKAENDLKVGGKFMTRMQAKEGSNGFDFNGVYTKVEKNKLIEYRIEGGRMVEIKFDVSPDGVMVTESFDIENENPAEMQRAGWQSIFDNFKRYVENEG